MSEIGVCIYWGPWGGELMQSPLVSLGEGSDCIVPEVPSLVKEDQVWMIANDASRSVYSLYAKVPCSNSQDAVQLLVSCTMAKERHLVSKSPLDLLEALKALFGRLFIVKKSEVRPRLERVDASFVQLLTTYSLETCPWYVFEMEGLQPGSFRVEDRDQLDALMRYNAYPVLAHVEHLELGFKCKTTVEINTKGESVGHSKTKARKTWLNWGRKDTKPEPSSQETKRKELNPSKKEVPPIDPKASISSVPSQNNGDVGLKQEPYYLLFTEFSRQSNREAIEFVNHNLGNRIKILIGSKVSKSAIRPSEAKDAIENGAISIFPTEIEDYSLSISKAVLDDPLRRFIVRIEAKKVRNGKKQEKKNELFGRKGLLPKKLKVPVIITMIIVAIVIIGSFVGSINDNINHGKEGKRAEKGSVNKMLLPQETSNFPYNTQFTGTIGSKGEMTIDGNGGGSYSYEINGVNLSRNIKVRSFESTSGHLIIEGYDKSGNYVGSFDGYTKNKNYYSGTFTNFNGGSVGFSLFVK